MSFHSQQYYFKSNPNIEGSFFYNEIKKLNKEVLRDYKDKDKAIFNDNIFRLHILDGDYQKGIYYLNEIKNNPDYANLDYREIIGLSFELYALSKSVPGPTPYNEKYRKVFEQKIDALPEKTKMYVSSFFRSTEKDLKDKVINALKKSIKNDSISLADAVKLCRLYTSYLVVKETNPVVLPFIKKAEQQQFEIKDSIVIKSNKGNEISLQMIRYKGSEAKVPTILNFGIYRGRKIDYAEKLNAMKGYVIVYATSRGVYLSKDNLAPFEFETEDVNEVIDWIIKQSWSDGKVGMAGGSYNGFSQWAAVKNMHPALKTIVPSASVGFGIDFPMENNVFNTYMIRWLEYVSRSRYVDYDDSDTLKWQSLVNKMYTNGTAFKDLDSLNGNKNVFFQKWVQHPSFDTFWTSKIPYKRDFAKVNIPVLTFTGYYDDDQRGAFYYYNEHYKYNKNADHYLVIGPYDHYGAQGAIKNNLRGYTIDPAANIDHNTLSYEWFDYILKGKKKPGFLKGKVNYQVMGTNQWKSAANIDEISNKKLKLFLSRSKLQEVKPALDNTLQTISFTNRKDTLQNFDRYKIMDMAIDPAVLKDKLVFESDALQDPVEINGSFTGNLKVTINKKDIDVKIILYELTSKGEYIQLSSYLGRASYAKNKEKRQLLVPGKISEIPVNNTYFVSKKIEKGSKLIIVLGVNTSPFEQMNYGTGKDVSLETIADAKEPLEIKWYNDSYVEIPILRQ
ncbi:CocE/NonD family hydrolase [Chryseobacterium sp. WX]|uniref:CocE/NonD family hydrolase n=1 Tax=Chryseobacterium sp. WX TaxID=3031803 RepID=UPI0024096918|nr:CocE/NonD family hydrolase [Chryseobacterium sp. WX]WFB66754.1 CocE/NonD family hydrolase [Chryseobacterium sp. WX]